MADDMWATPVVNGNTKLDSIGSPPSTADSAFHSEGQSESQGNILIDLDSQPSITPQSPPFDPLADLGSSPKNVPPPANQQPSQQSPPSFDPLADLTSAPKDVPPANQQSFDPLSDFNSAPKDSPPVNQQAPPSFDPLADLITAPVTMNPFGNNPFGNPAPQPQDANIFDPLSSAPTHSAHTTEPVPSKESNNPPFQPPSQNPFSGHESQQSPPLEVFGAPPPQPQEPESPKPDLTGAPGAPVSLEEPIKPVTKSEVHAAPLEQIIPTKESEVHAAPPGGVSALIEGQPEPQQQVKEVVKETKTEAVKEEAAVSPSGPVKESTFTVETKTETKTETTTEGETKTKTKTETKTETKKGEKTTEKKTVKKTVKTQEKPQTPRSTTRTPTTNKTPANKTTPKSGTASTTRPKSVPAPSSRIPTSPRKVASPRTPRTPRTKGAIFVWDVLVARFVLCCFACLVWVNIYMSCLLFCCILFLLHAYKFGSLPVGMILFLIHLCGFVACFGLYC